MFLLNMRRSYREISGNVACAILLEFRLAGWGLVGGLCLFCLFVFSVVSSSFPHPQNHFNLVLHVLLLVFCLFQARFLLSKVNPSQTHNNMYSFGGQVRLVFDSLSACFFSCYLCWSVHGAACMSLIRHICFFPWFCVIFHVICHYLYPVLDD